MGKTQGSEIGCCFLDDNPSQLQQPKRTRLTISGRSMSFLHPQVQGFLLRPALRYRTSLVAGFCVLHWLYPRYCEPQYHHTHRQETTL